MVGVAGTGLACFLQCEASALPGAGSRQCVPSLGVIRGKQGLLCLVLSAAGSGQAHSAGASLRVSSAAHRRWSEGLGHFFVKWPKLLSLSARPEGLGLWPRVSPSGRCLSASPAAPFQRLRCLAVRGSYLHLSSGLCTCALSPGGGGGGSLSDGRQGVSLRQLPSIAGFRVTQYGRRRDLSRPVSCVSLLSRLAGRHRMEDNKGRLLFP